MTIVSEITMLTYWHFVQKDIQKRADKVATFTLLVTCLCSWKLLLDPIYFK
jgi:hypothetical protein